MSFTNEPIPAALHAATAERVSRMMPKGKITVEFDAPAGLIGKHDRKCKPTINEDGTVTVQAFKGIWQAIPVQVLFEGRPAIVVWEAKHIRWTDEPVAPAATATVEAKPIKETMFESVTGLCDDGVKIARRAALRTADSLPFPVQCEFNTESEGHFSVTMRGEPTAEQFPRWITATRRLSALLAKYRRVYQPY